MTMAAARAVLGAFLVGLVVASGSVAAQGPAAPTPAATAAPSTVDDRARFLAGLPVAPDSVLAPLTATPTWRSYAAGLEKEWARMAPRLKVMAAWQAAELAPRVRADAPLLYFFGGPDAIAAVTLFPQAQRYLLAGLEPVGQVSAPERLKPDALKAALDALAFALRTTIPASFFRTSEMGRDLHGAHIRGVLPVVYLFLARAGCTVTGASFFEVDKDGVPQERAEGQKAGAGVPGFKVTFLRPGSTVVQELAYVSADLYDDNVKPGLFTFAAAYAGGNAMLKAASFILHDNHFSKTRSFILNNTAAIAQDDSGVPFSAFGKDGWDYTFFGKYVRPRKPFQFHYQTDLLKAWEAQPEKPLPFRYGYRREEDTSLMLAVRRATGLAQSPASRPGARPRPADPVTAAVASPAVSIDTAATAAAPAVSAPTESAAPAPAAEVAPAVPAEPAAAPTTPAPATPTSPAAPPPEPTAEPAALPPGVQPGPPPAEAAPVPPSPALAP